MALRQMKILMGTRLPRANEGSPVWQYFHFVKDHPEDPKNFEGHVICNMCSRRLTFQKRSTSTMWNHLRFVHSEYFLKLNKQIGGKKDPGVSASTGKTKGHHYPCSQSRTQRLTRVVGFHLAKSMQPFSTVEEPSFCKMLREFDPKYQLPSAETFSTSNLPVMHMLVKTRVVLPSLSKAEFVALSMEAWSTYTGAQFLTVSALFLDQDWKLKMFNLDTLPWTVPRSDAQLDKIVQDYLSDWAIPISKLSAVTGNVPTRKAGRESWVRVPCLRQALSNMVQAGMEEEVLTALRSKCRGLPEFSKSSCSSLDWGRSEWEALCDTFSHVLEQETADDRVQQETHGDKFSKDEIQVMEDFVEILQPLRELSAELGEEQSANSAAAILPSFALMKTILCPLETDGSSVAVVKCVMFTKMRECFDSQALTDLLAKVCFLDPRFKALPFMSKEERTKVKQDLVREADEMFPSEVKLEEEEDCDQPKRKKKRRSLALLFQDIIPQSDAPGTSSEGGSTIEREFSKYSAEEELPLPSNPLEWWAANALRFPTLQHLAKKYLCIPASILAYNGCPRKLSRRACLPTSDASRLLFLHDNMPDDFLDSTASFVTEQSRDEQASEEPKKTTPENE